MLAILLIFIQVLGLKLFRTIGAHLGQYLAFGHGLECKELLLFLGFRHTLTIIINMINKFAVKMLNTRIFIDRWITAI